MARMKESDRKTAVQTALTAAGGTMTHNDLVAALEVAGKAEAAESLLRMKKESVIYARLESQATGRPVLSYSLTPFPVDQSQEG